MIKYKEDHTNDIDATTSLKTSNQDIKGRYLWIPLWNQLSTIKETVIKKYATK